MPGEPEPENEPLPINPAPNPAPTPTRADEDAQASVREAMDRLNENNRILIEARMLPRTKPLTEEQINGVRARYKEYTERVGASGAQVAKEIGYSKTVISEWLSGKYAGNTDKITHGVNDWMERDAKRQLSRRPKDYVSTRIAESIRSIVDLADKKTRIAVIVVPAGAGKTKVLKILCEQMQGLYLYCDQQMTPRGFLRLLAEALDCKSVSGTTGELQRKVIQKLEGTKRIILLDEAHQLGKALNCVRSIHDQAGVPIVLAGTADILEHVNDRSDGRGQFSSRCFFYNAMEQALDAERPDGGSAGARDLFTLEEIRQFFQMKQIRLADDALMLCWSLACLPNHGTLRLIESTVEIVLDLNLETEIVTRSQVVEALGFMVGMQTTRHLTRVAARHQEMSKVA